jgi:hypothetical protein
MNLLGRSASILIAVAAVACGGSTELSGSPSDGAVADGYIDDSIDASGDGSVDGSGSDESMDAFGSDVITTRRAATERWTPGAMTSLTTQLRTASPAMQAAA